MWNWSQVGLLLRSVFYWFISYENWNLPLHLREIWAINRVRKLTRGSWVTIHGRSWQPWNWNGNKSFGGGHVYVKLCLPLDSPGKIWIFAGIMKQMLLAILKRKQFCFLLHQYSYSVHYSAASYSSPSQTGLWKFMIKGILAMTNPPVFFSFFLSPGLVNLELH